MSAQEYMDTLELATQLQCVLPVRNTWESMGIIMEGWTRGQNPRDIVGLAKCGKNELQIMSSIYQGTVQQDLQEAIDTMTARAMIRATQASGFTSDEVADALAAAWSACHRAEAEAAEGEEAAGQARQAEAGPQETEEI